MSKFSIAGHADIPQLEQLVNGAYRGEYSKKGWTTEADLIKGIRVNPAMLAEMIDNPNAVILKVTAEEGGLEGCVYLEQAGNKLYLGLLTVSPELQAKGIGRLLLDESMRYAKEKKLEAVYMTVISARTELIAWYERRGFRKTGEVKPFPVQEKLMTPTRRLELLVLEKQVENNPV